MQDVEYFRLTLTDTARAELVAAFPAAHGTGFFHHLTVRHSPPAGPVPAPLHAALGAGVLLSVLAVLDIGGVQAALVDWQVDALDGGAALAEAAWSAQGPAAGRAASASAVRAALGSLAALLGPEPGRLTANPAPHITLSTDGQPPVASNRMLEGALAPDLLARLHAKQRPSAQELLACSSARLPTAPLLLRAHLEAVPRVTQKQRQPVTAAAAATATVAPPAAVPAASCCGCCTVV